VLFSLAGAFLALLFNHIYSNFLIHLKTSKIGRFIYSFFNQKWFFDKIYNLYFIKPVFHLSYTIPFRLLDKGFIELFGPLGLTIRLNSMSKVLSKFQTGLIYHYTFIILVGTLLYINIGVFFNA